MHTFIHQLEEIFFKIIKSILFSLLKSICGFNLWDYSNINALCICVSFSLNYRWHAFNILHTSSNIFFHQHATSHLWHATCQISNIPHAKASRTSYIPNILYFQNPTSRTSLKSNILHHKYLNAPTSHILNIPHS